MKFTHILYHLLCRHRSSFLRTGAVALIMTLSIISDMPSFSNPPPRYVNRFETAAGYGFPESISLKVSYGNDLMVGLSQAFDTQGLGPSALEIYYRIGQKTRYLDQKPWYILAGIAGFVFDVDYKEEYTVLFYPRFGRSLYYSKNFGTNIDIGLGIPFERDKNVSNPLSPVLLTGSISLFVRF